MDSKKLLESDMDLLSTTGSDNLNVGCLYNNGVESEEVGSDLIHNDSSKCDLLEDLDAMMEDIDNRLKISRMVSGSVIKGIVNAVGQEVDEKMKAKELEIASLKKCLHVSGDQNESLWLQEVHHEPEAVDSEGYMFFGDYCVKNDEMKESLLLLRKSVIEQFKMLRTQIGSVCGSYNESVVLGGNSKDKECESWVSLDKTVDNLEMMINTMCRRVDGMLMFSMTALCESQWEKKFQEKIEAVVVQSYIRRLQEKYEEEVRDENASSCVCQYVAWADKFNEISGLRNDLDSLSKLLPSSDSGNLLSHGSFDSDTSPGKPLSSQLSSGWEENGKSDESKTDKPNKFDVGSLNHLTREELVNFFNNRISTIKREHESIVQHMTENYIGLKGKYLNERRSVVPHKDFETLRRKIPQVISQLDKVLVEGDKILECCNGSNSLNSLSDKVDSAVSEKHQLRDSLASEKTLQHASSEASVQKLLKTSNLSITDSGIEASIRENVYKCVIGELDGQIKNMKEESEMQIIAVHEIYEVLLKEASVGSETTNVCDINDSYMELLLTQDLSKIIFEETLREAKQKLESSFDEYLSAIKDLASLEKEVVKREAEILLEVEERSRKDVHMLGVLMEEMEHIARELAQEREQFKLSLDELQNLRMQVSWQETLTSKANKELDEISSNLLKAKDQIEVDKREITSLNQKLELAMEEKKTADDLSNRVIALTREKQSHASFVEAKEKEHKKNMEAVVVLVDGLSTMLVNFECRVRGDILRHNTRLENASSQLCSLIKAANVLKGTGLLYKQKLERKCSDLQMAEDEVDLLGDEVETLIGLLEKIYVALDHYSPVLQHYPGVTEILKLIRREVSGESMKLH